IVVKRITTAIVILHDSRRSISTGGNGATRTSTDATISTGKINVRERAIAPRRPVSVGEDIELCLRSRSEEESLEAPATGDAVSRAKVVGRLQPPNLRCLKVRALKTLEVEFA